MDPRDLPRVRWTRGEVELRFEQSSHGDTVATVRIALDRGIGWTGSVLSVTGAEVERLTGRRVRIVCDRAGVFGRWRVGRLDYVRLVTIDNRDRPLTCAPSDETVRLAEVRPIAEAAPAAPAEDERVVTTWADDCDLLARRRLFGRLAREVVATHWTEVRDSQRAYRRLYRLRLRTGAELQIDVRSGGEWSDVITRLRLPGCRWMRLRDARVNGQLERGPAEQRLLSSRLRDALRA
jgi:hypothetical protein